MTDDFIHFRKVATFPSAEAHTPQNTLARTLEKHGLIQHVAVYIKFKDGSCDVDFSLMPTSELFQAAALLHQAGMNSFTTDE